MSLVLTGTSGASNLDSTNGLQFATWTTGTRPASPIVGQMGYNTTTGLFDQYTAAGWSSVGAAPGSVIQVVNSTYSTNVTNNTSTYADTGLTATITPKFSTSKILVLISHPEIWKNAGNSANDIALNLCRNGTQINQISTSTAYTGTALQLWLPISYSNIDSPATTSATTYKTQFRNNDNNGSGVTIASGNAPSTMILMEIAA